jgi:hypothetical protein
MVKLGTENEAVQTPIVKYGLRIGWTYTLIPSPSPSKGEGGYPSPQGRG